MLLQEYEFVVCHVLLRVSFQVSPEFVKVEAVFVGTVLACQEKLTKLRCAKRGSYKALLKHKLVHAQDCNRTVPISFEGDVGRVGRTALATIVNVVRVDYDFFNASVLPKEFFAPESFFSGDVRRESDCIHKVFLDHPKVHQLFDSVFGQRGDRNLLRSSFVGVEPKLLERFDADVSQVLLAPAVNTVNVFLFLFDQLDSRVGRRLAREMGIGLVLVHEPRHFLGVDVTDSPSLQLQQLSSFALPSSWISIGI